MSLLNRRHRTFVGTLHCTLENGVYFNVNERQKIRNYRARSVEERRRRRKKKKKKKNAKLLFLLCVRKLAHGAYVNLRYIAMLYTHCFA